MATIYRGASLQPHFREFLPRWLAAQDWYTGDGTPSYELIGSHRFEDPAGEVGMETQLLRDGDTVYHVPMTYRGGPRPGGDPEAGLITTTEHSVLGTRWMYDAATDPAWIAELLRVIRENTDSEPGTKTDVPGTPAHGRLLRPLDAEPVVTVVRRLVAGGPVDDPAGVLLGTWHPDGPRSHGVTGCLATVHAS